MIRISKNIRLIVFIMLCISFTGYTFTIYIKPLEIKEEAGFNKEEAIEGRLVWQKYNCQSCHQLYGLGGYLGPDLTNVYSHPLKGESLIRALLKTGIAQMPAFDMSEKEIHDLIEFMKSTDASGIADPRTFKISPDGMIHGKHNKIQ